MREPESEHFHLPLSDAEIDGPIDGAAAGCEPLAPLAEAFKANVHGVNQMLMLPFLMTATKLREARWTRELQARCIRAGVHRLEGEERKKEEDKVRLALMVDAKSWEFPTSETLAELQWMVDTGAVTTAAVELLRHGLIGIWSAFELLAQDVFVAALNRNPRLVMHLRDNEAARKFFDIRPVKLETLADHGFDLSKRMGTMLVDAKSVDTVPAMKVVYQALCPDNGDLHGALERHELYVLSQRRNLIVHRRGIVDEQYARLSRDTVRVGEHLRLRGADLAAAADLVIDVGSRLLSASSALFAT